MLGWVFDSVRVVILIGAKGWIVIFESLHKNGIKNIVGVSIATPGYYRKDKWDEWFTIVPYTRSIAAPFPDES